MWDRAAESILGDDTAALRLAQQELRQLSQQLNQGLAGNTNGLGTNGMALAANEQGGQPGAERQGRAGANPGDQAGQQGDEQAGQQPDAPGQGNQNGRGQNGQNGRDNNGQPGGNGNNQGNGQPQAQAGQGGQGGNQPGNQPANGNGGNANGQGQNNQLAGGDGGQNEATGAEGRATAEIIFGGAGGIGGLNRGVAREYYGPLIDDNYVQWTDGLRDVEEMVDVPDVSTEVARIRERARTLHLEYKREGKRPDWAVITTQISTPLAEVRARVDEELLKRQSKDALVPLDRDPVPPKYSDQVKRYYEQLGKSD